MTGCTKVSAGCLNCYAERMASPRLRGRHGYPQDEPFSVVLRPERLVEPTRWTKPHVVFVCSMGDLFHEEVPRDFLDDVFAVMAQLPQHRFLVLTKRPARMKEYITGIPVSSNPSYHPRMRIASITGKLRNGVIDLDDAWPLPNVWLGTTTENQETTDERIPLLLSTPAAGRFISMEPMLTPIKLNLGDRTHVAAHLFSDRYGHWGRIHWVIVGGESGIHPRFMEADWARDIRDDCAEAGVAFFMKQMSGKGPIPEDLMIREYPW